MIIYDAGYGQDNKAKTLLARCDELNAVVIDTRFKPSSWRCEWRRIALQTLLGERYRWWGDVWGNAAFTARPGYPGWGDKRLSKTPGDPSTA